MRDTILILRFKGFLLKGKPFFFCLFFTEKLEAFFFHQAENCPGCFFEGIFFFKIGEGEFFFPDLKEFFTKV